MELSANVSIFIRKFDSIYYISWHILPTDIHLK